MNRLPIAATSMLWLPLCTTNVEARTKQLFRKMPVGIPFDLYTLSDGR